MEIKNFINRFIYMIGIGSALCLLPSCNAIFEDTEECPLEFKVKFRYDYNIKFADAFPNEVKSVDVWAFDEAGRFVWHDRAYGDPLSKEGFSIDVPLPEGKYSFLSWCGLKDNAGFDLDTYTPTSKEDLKTRLSLQQEEGLHVSKDRLAGLYHGETGLIEYKINQYAPTYCHVTIPLMKDTKDLRLMLVNLDGTPISESDFTASITYSNAWLDHSNAIMENSPEVTYRPWFVKYGETVGPESETRTVTNLSSLMFELSTSRLMADEKAWLTVKRTSDSKDIIHIDLISYLLMVKGHYEDATGREIGDQEYLDRQDDYSMMFFIDKTDGWHAAYGIYINGWAVVPPQNEGI